MQSSSVLAGACKFSQGGGGGIAFGDPDLSQGAVCLVDRALPAKGSWVVVAKKNNDDSSTTTRDLLLLHSSSVRSEALTWTPELQCSLPLRSSSGFICFAAATTLLQEGDSLPMQWARMCKESLPLVFPNGLCMRADFLTHLAWGRDSQGHIRGIRIRAELACR